MLEEVLVEETIVIEEQGIDQLEIIIIDLELYAKEGKKPIKGMKYRIRVDKQYFVVNVDELTGQQILELAGKNPPERFRLDQKIRGGATKKIELTDIVDFTAPGIEKFMTLPLDQTEG